MTDDRYLDTHDLEPSRRGVCPVAGCVAQLERVPSQWGWMPYCPVHRIRIHDSSGTFVYYHGADAPSKPEAAMRNIQFEREYFEKRVLGHAAKAESGRFCHETSEDALTWNVFSRLARVGSLRGVASDFADVSADTEPQLFLWGLRIDLNSTSRPAVFPRLVEARNLFEPDIRRFKTEPDVMLFVPDQLLLLVEAKFTSGNTLAIGKTTASEALGEKPRSRQGLLERYRMSELPPESLATPPSTQPFYSQLYRNLVFAIWMADKLGVRWGLVNLVSERQFTQRGSKGQFGNPTPFLDALLPTGSRNQFVPYTWERLYRDHVAKSPALEELAKYLKHKSAYRTQALGI